MCGIAGILQTSGAPADQGTSARLVRMARQLARRGPDEERVLCDGPFAVAFRRLSIVDLAGGSQPMVSKDGSVVAVVNGEIYNHRALRRRLGGRHQFASESDSEVVLHLYEEEGPAFLQHLNGMFALAVWDARRQQLLLARDRLGIKPLYYHRGPLELLFGSEIKALLADSACPREFDWTTALSYQGMQFQDQPERHASSFFVGIELLPAGHYLTADVRTGVSDVRRYWELPEADESPAATGRSEEQIVSDFRELVEDAVRLQMMADVEIGVFLSGGLDSSVITALAARSEQIHTFTVLGQSTFTNGDAEAAHELARHVGVPNHQVLFNWHETRTDAAAWKRLLWACETPLCQAEQLYKEQLHRYARSQRPGLKVILLGQGSDEFSGGYSRLWLRGLPEADQSWEAFLQANSTRNERAALVLQGLPALDNLEGRAGAPLVQRDFLAAAAGRTPAQDAWHYLMRRTMTGLDQYNLWHEDRTAAANGIESRVPFLDHRLVEFLARIPRGHRPALLWEKRILRRAAAGLMPDRLIQRPKVGFFMGGDERFTRRMMYGILSAEGGALIDEAVTARSGRHPVLDRDAILAFAARVPETPEYDGMDDLLALVNMGLLERMAEDVPDLPDVNERIDVLPAVRIEDWQLQKDDLALRLVQRRQIRLDRPVGLAANVCVVRDHSLGAEERAVYIAVSDELRYELDPGEAGAWIEVLRRLDGQRLLTDILDELGISEVEIRKHLEEALDYDLVELR